MYRTGEQAETTLNDSFPFFSPSYLHFPSVKESRVYLKSQPRQDLFVAVTAADRESAHGRRQRSEPPLCRRCCGSLPVSPPLRTHTRRCRGAVGGGGGGGWATYSYLHHLGWKALLKSVKLHKIQLLGGWHVCTHTASMVQMVSTYSILWHVSEPVKTC